MGVLSGWFPFDDYRADIVDVDSDKTLYYVFILKLIFFPSFLKGKTTQEKQEYVGKELINRSTTN